MRNTQTLNINPNLKLTLTVKTSQLDYCISISTPKVHINCPNCLPFSKILIGPIHHVIQVCCDEKQQWTFNM